MKIAYCTNVRLPSERAHGHQVAEVCRAMAALGHSVSVLAPFRKNSVGSDFWSYYGLPKTITYMQLGSFDPIACRWFPSALGLRWMNAVFRPRLRLTLSSGSFDLLYTRSPALLSVLLATGIPTIMELHTLPRFFRSAFVRQCNRSARVVCLTKPMAAELIARGVAAAKITVEGDAVDLAHFSAVPDAEEARREYDISGDAPVVVYAGQLHSMGLSKGLPELLGACAELHSRGRRFTALIAGGPASAIPALLEPYGTSLGEHVRFLGQLPHADIPVLLAAADVLVYPAPLSSHSFYHRDTSPMKLFEYMAAKRPIVAADLEPLHDVVDDTMVRFVRPGDSSALADGIVDILDNKDAAKDRVDAAWNRVQKCTWEHRMDRILQPLS